MFILEGITGIKYKTEFKGKANFEEYLTHHGDLVVSTVDSLNNVSFYELLVVPEIVEKHNIKIVMDVVAENFKEQVYDRIFKYSKLIQIFIENRHENILLPFLKKISPD